MQYAELPAAGDELSTLLGVLDRNRRTFAWKCGGLDAEGLRATVGVSTITSRAGCSPTYPTMPHTPTSVTAYLGASSPTSPSTVSRMRSA
jgi:hypothetical protein